MAVAASPAGFQRPCVNLANGAEFARFGDYLKACRFDQESACAALHISSIAEALSLTPGRNFSGVERKLAALIRLFLLLEDVDDAEFDGAFLDAAVALGLVHRDGGSVRSEVLLAPVAGLWAATDRHRSTDPNLAAGDGVYPAIADGTLRLLRLIANAPGTAALDIGAGSGIGALALAKRGVHAVAADITARSTRFAEFNRRLNALDHCEAVEGDLYAPVAGRTFDLIIAHPPYVPSLSGDKIYKAAGAAGEDIIRRIVAGLPEFLRVGGTFCAVTAGWEADDGKFEDRARRWLGDNGDDFDLAFAVNSGIEPEALAKQLSEREGGDRASWTSLFAGQGLRRLSYGALVITRRGRDGAAALTVRGPFGVLTDVAALLESMRWARWRALASAAALAQLRPRASASLKATLSYGVHEDQFRATGAKATTAAPFAAEENLDLWLLHVLTACSGEHTVADLHAGAREQGILPADLSLDLFAKRLAGLIDRGFLTCAVPS
jgi:SAM-dependent methyltransferase